MSVTSSNKTNGEVDKSATGGFVNIITSINILIKKINQIIDAVNQLQSQNKKLS